MSKERLGILGGTFNPIHAGHLAMARCALKQASLDRVIFLPDGMPPHKTGIASAKDRYIMISVAICQDGKHLPKSHAWNSTAREPHTPLIP